MHGHLMRICPDACGCFARITIGVDPYGLSPVIGTDHPERQVRSLPYVSPNVWSIPERHRSD